MTLIGKTRHADLPHWMFQFYYPRLYWRYFDLGYNQLQIDLNFAFRITFLDGFGIGFEILGFGGAIKYTKSVNKYYTEKENK